MGRSKQSVLLSITRSNEPLIDLVTPDGPPASTPIPPGSGTISATKLPATLSDGADLTSTEPLPPNPEPTIHWELPSKYPMLVMGCVPSPASCQARFSPVLVSQFPAASDKVPPKRVASRPLLDACTKSPSSVQLNSSATLGEAGFEQASMRSAAIVDPTVPRRKGDLPDERIIASGRTEEDTSPVLGSGSPRLASTPQGAPEQPIPPAPMGERTSYGPSCFPASRVMTQDANAVEAGVPCSIDRAHGSSRWA